MTTAGEASRRRCARIKSHQVRELSHGSPMAPSTDRTRTIAPPSPGSSGNETARGRSVATRLTEAEFSDEIPGGLQYRGEYLIPVGEHLARVHGAALQHLDRPCARVARAAKFQQGAS